MELKDANNILEIKANTKDLTLPQANQIEKTLTTQPIIKKEKQKEEKNMLNFLNEKMKEMETEYDQTEHLIIDLGHAFTKIGFSGEDQPRLCIPSIYGKLKGDLIDKKSELSFEIKQNLFGYDVLENKHSNYYAVKYLSPGDHKKRIDPEFLEFLKETIENQMGVTPSDYNVLINGSPIRNKENIIDIGSMLLEDMNFKGFSMVTSSSLALFATGRTSGIVVDCGESRTYTVPIFEGFPLYHALNKNKIGGKDLSELLLNEINESGIQINVNPLYHIRRIKSIMCAAPTKHSMEYYINTDEDIIKQERKLYKLPDESIIEIPKEARLRASELMFDPQIANKKDKDVITLLADTVKKTIIDQNELKQTMLNNIVLSGGTSKMPGFSERIQNDLAEELDYLKIHRSSLNIIAEGNREISTWVGASMIASMSTFQNNFIRKEEYNELGENRMSLFQKIF